MRKLMGFVLLCVCLSCFYYRFSQLAYQMLGEPVALKQLESIYQSMYKVRDKVGHFEYNLQIVKPEIFNNQSFGFRSECLRSQSVDQQQTFLINQNTDQHMMGSIEKSIFEKKILNYIHKYSECDRHTFAAVVVHAAFGRVGVYRINQDRQIEVIQTSRLDFIGWLKSLLIMV